VGVDTKQPALICWIFEAMPQTFSNKSVADTCYDLVWAGMIHLAFGGIWHGLPRG